MEPVKTFFHIVELRTKLVSVICCGSAVIAAGMSLKTRGLPFPVINALLLCLATLAVDMGTTGFNSYFDYIRGTDRKENNYEGDKVLLYNGATPGQAFFISAGLFALAMGLGLALSLRTSLWLLPVGALCMVAGYLYSGGPLPISRTPLGELFTGGFLGSVLYLISWYAIYGNLGMNALIFSLPLTLMISGILTVNNTCDIESDRVAGRKTLSILLGPRGGKILLYGEYGSAVLLLFLMQYVWKIYPQGHPAISAVLVAGMVYLIYKMDRTGFRLQTKGPSMQRILAVYGLGGLLMIHPWLYS